MPRTFARGVAAGVGTTVVVLGAVAIFTAKSDPPIEVADSSIEMYYKNGFDTIAGNQIKVSKFPRRTKQVEVWDKYGALYETIDVTNRVWAATSADGTLQVQRSSGTYQDEVAISSSNIQQVIAGDPTRFRYDNGSRFTPATLRFTDGKALPKCSKAVGADTCTLSCPTGYCSVRFQYKW